MMIVARLLTPADYGTFALVSSLTLWISAAGFENFAPNLLRDRGSETEIATYLLFGLLLQTGLLLLGLAIAGILWFAFELRLVAVLLAVSLLAFPLRAPGDIEVHLLQREFSWRRLRLVQIATLLLGSLAAVALARAGAGPFALVLPALVNPLPFACLLLAFRRPGPLRLDRELLRRVQAFGWPMVGASQAWGMRGMVGSWAVGMVLGTADLGLLGRAASLSASAARSLPPCCRSSPPRTRTRGGVCGSAICCCARSSGANCRSPSRSPCSQHPSSISFTVNAGLDSSRWFHSPAPWPWARGC
jgi:O-antigen/teichoic acid export membrane protein